MTPQRTMKTTGWSTHRSHASGPGRRPRGQAFQTSKIQPRVLLLWQRGDGRRESGIWDHPPPIPRALRHRLFVPKLHPPGGHPARPF